MNYLSQKFSSFTNYFVKSMDENKQRKVGKYERYFEQIYKIFCWEDNSRTLIIFLIVNFVFWIVVQWQVRIFGFLFSLMLVIFIYDSCFENKNLTGFEAKYAKAFDEISMYPRDVILNLKILRRENPSLFCIGMCIMWLLISFVARNTSGYVLIYLIILGTFFLPLVVKFMPDEYVVGICNIFKSLTYPRDVLAEEELIPFISDKDMNDADLESLLTDKTADSVSNSLMSGISAMPSYMDFPEIQKDIDEDDLIPSQSYRKSTPDHLSSDSDSEQQELDFDSSHFGTSSDEEKCLEKGLHFTSDSVDDAPSKVISDSAGLSGVLTNFAHMGGNLVANVFKSTVSTVPVQCENSSSDSDFEMINADDL